MQFNNISFKIIYIIVTENVLKNFKPSNTNIFKINCPIENIISIILLVL